MAKMFITLTGEGTDQFSLFNILIHFMYWIIYCKKYPDLKSEDVHWN